MEGSPVRNERKGKAKVEEADESYPSSEPKSTSNTLDCFYYLKVVGQLRIHDAVGPNSLEGVTRNLFRVRNRDVPYILRNEDERLMSIHNASGATIGIISDPEGRIHRQVFLELMGTLDQVKIAELLIADSITEMYDRQFVPTALMPPGVCHHAMSIPLPKVIPLLGFKGENLMKMEVETGAWIEVDTFELPAAGQPLLRGVNIYGSLSHITNALNMIYKIVYEEPVRPKCTQDILVEELTSIEEADEYQESSEDEKQEHVEIDVFGEKSACIEYETQPNVKEADAKESDQLVNSNEALVYGEEAEHKEHAEE